MTPSQKSKIDQATKLVGRSPDVDENKHFVSIKWKRREWFGHCVVVFINKRGGINSVFVDGYQHYLRRSGSWKSVVLTYAQ